MDTQGLVSVIEVALLRAFLHDDPSPPHPLRTSFTDTIHIPTLSTLCVIHFLHSQLFSVVTQTLFQALLAAQKEQSDRHEAPPWLPCPCDSVDALVRR